MINNSEEIDVLFEAMGKIAHLRSRHRGCQIYGISGDGFTCRYWDDKGEKQRKLTISFKEEAVK